MVASRESISQLVDLIQECVPHYHIQLLIKRLREVSGSRSVVQTCREVALELERGPL